MLFKPSDENFSLLDKANNDIWYLGIDPGKHNGICGYDVKCNLMFMFTVMAEDVVDFLDHLPNVKKCICEDFLLYPNKAQQQIYSSMETSRVIGRVESWARLNRIELIKQKASIKKTAYAWMGKKPPTKSDPLNHEKDGNAHFIYWAVRNKYMDAKALLKLG